MKEIFVGNKITMEGTNVVIPKEIENYRDSIDDAVYYVFESSFVEKEHKNFIKTMKMNGVLFGFIEHHIKNFCNIYKKEIVGLSKDNNDIVVKDMAKNYFIKSLDDYRNRILSVKF